MGKEIEELVFSPTEFSKKIGERSITVTRMDFSAKIRDANGSEQLVLIELQKSKFLFQIMRFRRYLGSQYQNPENVIVKKNKNGEKQKEGLPIYPIYILGEAFTEEIIPVINVKRNYIDAATKEKILEQYPFIESLTHDATIIQVPHLKENRRTTLERFLEIFDQNNRSDGTGHFLSINETAYPENFQSVIRRLKKALANPKIEADMNMEDDVIEEFNQQEKRLEKADKLLKEKAEQLEAAIQEKENMIRNLAATNLTLEEIAKVASIDIAAIRIILNRE